jgi:endonuclease YncB( thermonuclease family)
VVKVLDGDSLRVERDGRLHELRLYGIDAPEHGQPHGDRARGFARHLLDGQVVAVAEKDVDRYGRIVALVTCRDVLVNRELVQQGFAWPYPRYCRSEPLCSELTVLADEARAARRGLWADAEPVAPWEWKRRKREGSGERPGWRRWLEGWW